MLDAMNEGSHLPMEVADVLKASVKVCMFDQYGTIVDMQTGLTEIAKPYLESKGWK